MTVVMALPRQERKTAVETERTGLMFFFWGPPFNLDSKVAVLHLEEEEGGGWVHVNDQSVFQSQVAFLYLPDRVGLGVEKRWEQVLQEEKATNYIHPAYDAVRPPPSGRPSSQS